MGRMIGPGWIVLLLPALAFGWLRADLPCAANCTRKGNCNKELGICECAYGWMGPTCEQPTFPACRTSREPGQQYMLWGRNEPVACACLTQVRDFVCMPERMTYHSRTGYAYCDHHIWYYWVKAQCFVRTALSLADQYSEVPYANDTNVDWYQGTVDRFGKRKLVNTPPPGPWVKGEPPLFFPLSMCPNRCSEQGLCVGHTNASVSCTCYTGWRGPICDIIYYEVACRANGCTERGTCKQGFCHCQPGWWGMDCTRSQAWKPDPAEPLQLQDRAFNRTHVRIYRFELPWHVAMARSRDHSSVAPRATGDPLYHGPDLFEALLSRDTQVLTENPWEANLFYVQGYNYYYSGNLNSPSEHLTIVFNYIADHYPVIYSRNLGKDFVYAVVHDVGACSIVNAPRAMRAIKITYFGAQDNTAYRESDMVQRVVFENETSLRNVTGKPHMLQHDPLVAPNNESGVVPILSRYPAPPIPPMPSNVRLFPAECFTPLRDVVVPAVCGRHVQSHTKHIHLVEAYRRMWLPNVTNRLKANRTHLLYFGGDIRSQTPFYSGGARQFFFKTFVEDKPAGMFPDLIFNGNGVDCSLKAEFCMVAYGEGFASNRLVVAMLMQCIIVQDGVHQAFEDIIPYADFSIRIRHSEIPELLAILRAIPESRRQELRTNGIKYSQAQNWNAASGGLAYNYTILSLHKRLQNLWGFFFR